VATKQPGNVVQHNAMQVPSHNKLRELLLVKHPTKNAGNDGAGDIWRYSYVWMSLIYHTRCEQNQIYGRIATKV